jgi:hypothetical protein
MEKGKRRATWRRKKKKKMRKWRNWRKALMGEEEGDRQILKY